MESRRIDFDLVGIGSLLKTRLFAVPIYQRSYSWKSENINDFCEDLKTAFAEKDPEYFLGTVVLTSEGKTDREFVIDGQQRLATTTMLIAAIRDEYRNRGDNRDSIIQANYLSDRDLGSGDETPKLVLNSDDDSYFRKLVIESAAAAVTINSHANIRDAYASLQVFAKETADAAGGNWAKHLNDWISFLTDGVSVVMVRVPTEADAFLIFETLNDRGADLTIADLLKNYLFGKAGTRLDSVRDGWMKTLGLLDLTAEESLFTTFLRHYWSSRFGATRERSLYQSIKSNVTNEQQAVDLVAELQVAAKYYAALRNSDDDYWNDKGTAAKANLETILRLDLEQNRPLLIAAMQYFTTAELKKLLKSTVAWSVRGLIVGGIGGGTTERAYCAAAVKIRSGALKTCADVRTELAAIVATDAQFETAFAHIRVPKASLARYYLYVLERKNVGTRQPELVPNQDEEQVNLEHVLPKSWKSADWPQFDIESAKSYVHRLGNMTLLAKGPNDSIGNKAWTVKKPILAASTLSLTKTAGAEAKWNEAVIDRRQKELAKLAVAAWPR